MYKKFTDKTERGYKYENPKSVRYMYLLWCGHNSANLNKLNLNTQVT